MNKTVVIFLILTQACRCEEKLQQVNQCDTPCSPGNSEIFLTGECHPGRWDCDAGRCADAKGPEEEACDGLDNNCDGRVDDGVSSCATACGTGYMRSCDPTTCSARQPQPEVCDNVDNDCNGAVDDGLPIVFCYTGPEDTIGNGTCRPGFLTCHQGKAVCINQVLPKPEICNYQDDDCDGQVDEGVSEYGKLDIVFVIDNSGSMVSFMPAVKTETSYWYTNNWNMDLRVGVVGAPAPHQATAVPTVIQDLTPNSADFLVALQAQDGISGTGNEPNLDAINMLTQGTLPMSWRQGAAHVIVVYSDEVPQTYGSQTLPWPGWVVHVFTTRGYSMSEWGYIPAKLWDLGALDSSNLEEIAKVTVCP